MLIYHVYFIAMYVQLHEAIAIAYGDYLKAEATTGVDWEAANV